MNRIANTNKQNSKESENSYIIEDKAKFLHQGEREEEMTIYNENADIWKKFSSFSEYARSLKELREQELAQMIRRYQFSYRKAEDMEEYLHFGVNITPLCFKKEIKPIVLAKEFLTLDIILSPNYPTPANDKDVVAYVSLALNEDIDRCIRDAIEFMINSLVKKSDKFRVASSLKYLESYLPSFVTEALGVLDKFKGEWSQTEQNRLEFALKIYKSVTDVNEKWKKISSFVRTKTKSECVERVKAISEKLASAKNSGSRKTSNASNKTEENSEENKTEESVTEEDEKTDEYSSNEESKGSISEDEAKLIEESEEVNKLQDEEKTNDIELPHNLEQHQMKIDDVAFGLISLATVVRMTLEICCSRCKNQCDAHLVRESRHKDIISYSNSCGKCSSSMTVFFKSTILHQGNMTDAGFLYIENAIVKDTSFCDYEVRCNKCDCEFVIRKLIPNTPKLFDCLQCFQKCSLKFSSVTWVKTAVDADMSIRKAYVSTKNLAKKRKTGGAVHSLKLGTALPELGACKHYKKSYRWFRFPCCGKAFPCDICHDNVSDHPFEMGKSIICGHCSKEQPVSKEGCINCQKNLTYTKTNTRFWEGGKGCRDKDHMSNKDSKKFKNSKHKTRSSKKKK